MNLRDKYKELESRLNVLKARKKEQEETKGKLEVQLTDVKKKVTLLNESISLSNKCLEESIELKKHIEDLGTALLTEVMAKECIIRLDPQFSSDNIIKGLKLNISLDGEDFDSLSEEGDGIKNVLSIFLRICFLLLGSQTEKVIVLDEPFPNLSPFLWSRVEKFLKGLVDSTPLQVIIVTHVNQPFGSIFKVFRENGISRVEKEGDD